MNNAVYNSVVLGKLLSWQWLSQCARCHRTKLTLACSFDAVRHFSWRCPGYSLCLSINGRLIS